MNQFKKLIPLIILIVYFLKSMIVGFHNLDVIVLGILSGLYFFTEFYLQAGIIKAIEKDFGTMTEYCDARLKDQDNILAEMKKANDENKMIIASIKMNMGLVNRKPTAQ
jgi:hypothetical protein